MANTDRAFDRNLDKITEREVVPDFVSRLSLGKNFEDKISITDHNGTTNNSILIIPRNTKLKDGLLTNFARTFDLSDLNKLGSIKTTYGIVNEGDTSVYIKKLEGYELYRIVQEKTKQEVTACFIEDDGMYKASFDIPATHNDVYKAYFYRP